MASNLPPHLQDAFDHLSQRIETLEKRKVDLLKAPWGELEKSVIKALGGKFSVEVGEHQAVALGLAAALGERLVESDKAFWFPNRESPEAAMLGFTDAILMISPFGAVMDALGKSNLASLDAVAADVRKSLAQSKFSVTAGTPPRLTPEDYRRLFDAGFIQISRVDPKRFKSLMDSRPDSLIRDFREALTRSTQLPPEARQQFEQQVVSALQRLEPAPLSTQVAKTPRLVELLIHLFATVGATGAAPEEFWYDAVVPLLLIGAPPQFPPLDGEELDMARQGADPLALYLDVVPYQQKAPEEGLLGLFDSKDITLPHPELGRGQVPPRLLQLKKETVLPLAQKFDGGKTRDAIKRFTAYLSEKAGKPLKASEPAEQMVEAAVMLLTDLKKVIEDAAKEGSDLCLRRITEAEATSEGALALVRTSLQGPRIILAGI